MAAVRMTALRDFERGGWPVVAGQVFMAKGVEVALLRKRGLANFSRLVPAPAVEPKAVQAEEPVAPPAPRRRTYRRRDMAVPERADMVAEG